LTQETHNPGNVHLEEDHGMTWLMRASTVDCTKLIFDRDALSSATLSPSASVTYRGQKIGSLHSKQYNKLDGFLVGFFTLTVARHALPEADCLYAVPLLDSKQIQCVNCHRYFVTGNVACECIEKAPVIQIPKIHITGVSIFNGMDYDINMCDARRALLNQYFGGVVASICLRDEEF